MLRDPVGKTSDLARLRCRSQRIGAGAPLGPVDVVRHLLAVQAQDLGSARWAVGLRTPGATAVDVDAALASGAVVRSWPMRGTLHLVPGEDLGWMLALSTPRLLAGVAARRRALALDDDQIERARAIAVRALDGGAELTREALLAALEAGGVSTAGQRGYHLVWTLAQTGTLCWGRVVGKEQVLVLLEAWVRQPRRLERDEALGELAARYVAGHGPATRHDLARWAGLTAGDTRRAVEVAGERVRTVTLDGVSHLVSATLDDGPETADERTAFEVSVHALPGFDEYVLGYQDRSAVLSPAHQERIVPGGNGIFLPMIVAGGRVVGTWTREARARRVTCAAVPFTRLTRSQVKGFADAVGRYGRFLGIEASVA